MKYIVCGVGDFADDELGYIESSVDKASLQNIVNQLFNFDGRYVTISIHEVREPCFNKTFYVYRYVNGDFRNVQYIGEFQTDLKIFDVYDMMFEIFNGDHPDGIFVRTQKI